MLDERMIAGLHLMILFWVVERFRDADGKAG
jgi:hypothetical protein